MERDKLAGNEATQINITHSPICDSVLIPYAKCNCFKQYKEEAIRNSHPIRYDILDPLFLDFLARIADYGAKKYGNFNWQKSHLTDDRGCINHIYKHLKSFRLEEPYDHPEIAGEGKEMHLAAIAFNAMMEFYWVMKEKNDRTTTS